MESIEGNYESVNKLQSSQSDDEIDQKKDSVIYENPESLNLSSNKEYSMERNFFNLEQDLQLLTKEVKKLREQNSRLKTKIKISSREKEIHIENYSKDLLKLTKENKKLKEEIMIGKKAHQQENDMLKDELGKIQKSYKKFLHASESKIKKLENELAEAKNESDQQLQTKDKEISVNFI